MGQGVAKGNIQQIGCISQKEQHSPFRLMLHAALSGECNNAYMTMHKHAQACTAVIATQTQPTPAECIH